VGVYTVDGLRQTSDQFSNSRIEGVSKNFAIAPAGQNPSQSTAGAAPALTASGGAQSIATLAPTQEVTTQTPSAQAEYGGAGSQVEIVTRSGTNSFRRSIFHFFGNDWFAKGRSLAQRAKRLNFFGRTFGRANALASILPRSSFSFDLNPRNATWMIGDEQANVQRQFNLSGSLVILHGNHDFKFAGDYRRRWPVICLRTAEENAFFERMYFGEAIGLQLQADGFNRFKRANFEDPNDLVLGPNLAFGGFPSFYSFGGARTIRLPVKFLF